MAHDPSELPSEADGLTGDRPGGHASSRTPDPGHPDTVPAPVNEDAAGGGGGDAGAPVRPRRSDARAARSSKRSGSFLRELPVLLLIAFVLAFLLRTFVLQVFYIPSASMQPTLMVNDRMVVEKVTYLFREPRRGEIVVFEGESSATHTEGNGPVSSVIRGVGQFLGVIPASARDFVKRVIGLPGDEVFIDDDGVVYVNGEQLEEPYIQPEQAGYGPIIVPDDRLFFLGDNRANSSDSRRSLGFVPRDQVVGRAFVVIWPLGHAGRLTGVEHDVPAGDPDPPAEDEVPAAELEPVG